MTKGWLHRNTMKQKGHFSKYLLLPLPKSEFSRIIISWHWQSSSSSFSCGTHEPTLDQSLKRSLLASHIQDIEVLLKTSG
ncbi:hypothetical protein L3X38_040092 [Prunus dulcis]|uniref:Uncharacterized protein n=1 Tax=Prunus dulcis TaxID=3755 RepID=A0AAD4V8C6_PRUDU|nr:hypothetical protein L3X38_040092 [Prunus dulcis]